MAIDFTLFSELGNVNWFFSDYLRTVEGFLEETSSKYAEQRNKFWELFTEKAIEELERERGVKLDSKHPLVKKRLSSWQDQINYEWDALYFGEVDSQINKSILRESFFISLYAHLVARLFRVCAVVGEHTGNNSSPKQFRGMSELEQVEQYLTKEVPIGFDFSSNEKWKELNLYRKLRNCFIHEAGIVADCRHAADLQNYVNNKETLSLGDQKIIIRMGFCQEALKTVDEFWDSLISSIVDFKQRENITNTWSFSLYEISSEFNIHAT